MKPKFTYNEYETKEAINDLTGKLHDLNAKEGLSPEGNNLRVEIVNHIADLAAHLEQLQPQRALTVELNSGQSFGKSNRGLELLPPNAKKDYKSLFGSSGGYSWQDKEANFLQAVFSGRYHPGLIKNSMSETVPSDGGFLVPTEMAARDTMLSVLRTKLSCLVATFSRWQEMSVPFRRWRSAAMPVTFMAVLLPHTLLKAEPNFKFSLKQGRRG